MVFKTRKGFVYFGRHCAFMFDGHYFNGANPFDIERCVVLDVVGLTVLIALATAVSVLL